MATIPILATATYERLLALAKQRTFEVSAGRLNDTSEAGVLTALLASQSQAISDQNNLLNTLPELATLTLLQAMGIGLSPGVAARVEVTLVLNQVLTAATTIGGFRIARAGIPFQVVGNQSNGSLIEIPAGASTVTTIAIAQVYGKATNVGAGTWQILEPSALVQAVVSGESAAGGEDPDSLATTSADVLAEKLSAGSLTRTTDFEREMRKLLGVGSVALAIGKLGADRQTKQLGAVHVFGLNPDGTELTATQTQSLQLGLNNSSPLADVFVSSMATFKMKASVIVVLSGNADGRIVSGLIWDGLRAYIRPISLPPGEAVYVNEAVVLVGNIAGVERVQSVSMGEVAGVPQPSNQILPFPWSVPRLDSIVVRCVFGRNETVYSYGS